MKKINADQVTKLMYSVEDNYKHKIKKLERERDKLAEEVSTSAYCNYAREPEFVRDRLRLRELSRSVSQLLRQLNSKHIEPLVGELRRTEKKLVETARRYEEESELVAQRFLNTSHQPSPRKCNSCEPMASSSDVTTVSPYDPGIDHIDQQLSPTPLPLAPPDDEKRAQEFIRDYIEVRKKAVIKRTLADKLSGELELLAGVCGKSVATTTGSCPSPVRKGNKDCT